MLADRAKSVFAVIRTRQVGLANLLIPVLGILTALLIGALLVLISGNSPLAAYEALLDGSFGSLYSTTFTLLRSVPLIITAVGIAFALRAGILNLGAEGQIYFGALGATWAATVLLTDAPAPLQAPVAILIGVALGAAWGAIPGVLRAYLEVNEIVVGIMLNFVAILTVSYFVQGPLARPNATYPQSYRIPETAMLPKIIEDTQLTTSFIMALIVVVIIDLILRRNALGWRVRITGFNPKAAQYAGINPKRILVVAMVISGGLSGLAGSVEILGAQGVLVDNFSPGYGFEALAVALLAQLSPMGVIPSAIFFSALRTGSSSLQRNAGIPANLAFVIQALAVLAVVGFSGGTIKLYLGQTLQRLFGNRRLN
jgi:simple sugar transport system permease protein